ncbi:MAG: MFS transporter [Candidatus Riflebacteria bacterium]
MQKKPENKGVHRWVVLAACVMLQVVLGGIYAWSSFVPALMEKSGFTAGQCGAVFGLTVAVFAVSLIPAGRFLQIYGPRVTAVTGSLLFGAGYVLASYSAENYLQLLLSYALIVGTGTGFGYVCPLTTGMKWFPDNRGLVTGVSVAGFGGGAIVLSLFAGHLTAVHGFGVFEVFRVTGFLFGSLAFFSSLLIVDPENFEQNQQLEKEPIAAYLLQPSFMLILAGMFAGTFAGLTVVGNLKPMMLEFGLTDELATLAISLFALGNIAGRIGWGQIHDRLGSRLTILGAKALLFVSILGLHTPGSEYLLLAAVVFTGAGFGGCFVIYASTIVEKFGVRLFSRLYPVCFLGYGAAALLGPWAGGWIADIYGSFSGAINLAMATVLLATLPILAFFDREIDEKISPNRTKLLLKAD